MRYISMAALLTLVVTASPASAQTPERQSAIGGDLADYGGFVGLDMRFGDMANDFAVFTGGHAALLLKHRVYLGVSGAGLATDARLATPTSEAPGPSIDMGYGGVLIGYIVPTRSLVQFTAEALIAGGGVRLGERSRPDDDEDWDPVFVFQPTAGAEIELAPIVRLGLGVGYRFVGGVDTSGLSDSDLRGVTGSATLRLGWF